MNKLLSDMKLFIRKATVIVVITVAYGPVLAQTGYFRVAGGIPHLPVVSNTASVESMGVSNTVSGLFTIPVLGADPQDVSAGAIYFSSVLKELRVYTGSGWSSACDAELPAPPEWP